MPDISTMSTAQLQQLAQPAHVASPQNNDLSTMSTADLQRLAGGSSSPVPALPGYAMRTPQPTRAQLQQQMRQAPANPSTLSQIPGAIVPGLRQGVGDVGTAIGQAGEGIWNVAKGVATGAGNAIAGTGDEAMAAITGNRGGYARASQQHAAAINPDYANPSSYVPGAGNASTLAQAVAQNPTIRGFAGVIGAGSGGWSDNLAKAIGSFAGGDPDAGKKMLAAIPVGEAEYIAKNPASFGVNTLLFTLGGRAAILAKLGDLTARAAALSKTGLEGDLVQAQALTKQARGLRQLASGGATRAVQRAVSGFSDAIGTTPVISRTVAAAGALNRFQNPIEAARNAPIGDVVRPTPQPAAPGQEIPSSIKPQPFPGGVKASGTTVSTQPTWYRSTQPGNVAHAFLPDGVRLIGSRTLADGSVVSQFDHEMTPNFEQAAHIERTEAPPLGTGVAPNEAPFVPAVPTELKPGETMGRTLGSKLPKGSPDAAQGVATAVGAAEAGEHEGFHPSPLNGTAPAPQPGHIETSAVNNPLSTAHSAPESAPTPTSIAAHLRSLGVLKTDEEQHSFAATLSARVAAMARDTGRSEGNLLGGMRFTSDGKVEMGGEASAPVAHEAAPVVAPANPASTPSLLPEPPAIPQHGTFPAVRTDDGSIYVDTSGKPSTHLTFTDGLGVPRERIESGGYVRDGDYVSSHRSDAATAGEQARAAMRAQSNRASRVAAPAPTVQPVKPSLRLPVTSAQYKPAGVQQVQAETAAPQPVVHPSSVSPPGAFTSTADVIARVHAVAPHIYPTPEERAVATTALDARVAQVARDTGHSVAQVLAGLRVDGTGHVGGEAPAPVPAVAPKPAPIETSPVTAPLSTPYSPVEETAPAPTGVSGEGGTPPPTRAGPAGEWADGLPRL